MNWDNLLRVWNEILDFFNRTFEWLEFLFTEGKWPTENPLPDVNAK